MAGATRPNVLIILSDQLRRSALECYGDRNISTPNINTLSERGVHFNNACSTYPLCVPFRFTLMTGQYAHTCMIPTLGWRMSPAERTLADEFNEAGYQTAYFGKWHLYSGQISLSGYSAREESTKPVPRSHQGRWQYWRGFELCNAPFNTYYFIDDDPKPHKIDGYQTDGLFDLAMDFLRNQRDQSKPFCCVVSVEPPHDPYEVSEELEKKRLDRDIELASNFMVRDEGSFQPNYGSSFIDESQRDKVLRNQKIYYAMIENLDENVGRIMRLLAEENLLDETIVMFFADHGELVGSHGLTKKQFPYEESIGIPLIVAGSGIPQNARIDEPVCTEDLFPTILGLAGLAPHVEPPGCNLAPLIQGRTDELNRPGVLLQFVWETRPTFAFYGQIWRGFRSRRYKYTVLGDIKQGLRPWQFFDLKKDPCELNNLIDDPDYNELVGRHHSWLCRRMREIGDDEVRLL